VRSHLDAVMAKLGVTRKLEAVRLLAQGGWMWRAWPSEEMRDA
jgi:DNA-binding NarL/FixJ family response regulator